MKITKLGHCCMLIEEHELRILTDPGKWSGDLSLATDIDIILITHEHEDHVHAESLRYILKSNPQAIVSTNKSVGKILDKLEIAYQELKEPFKIKDVLIEPIDTEHAVIYKTIPNVQNTCLFINNRLFYPGDSFYVPEKHAEILALPVAGPWTKVSDAIDYALKLKPVYAFPVHDGMLPAENRTPHHKQPEAVLHKHNIKFMLANEGTVMHF